MGAGLRPAPITRPKRNQFERRRARARYKMRQRLISLGEDYDIEDAHGRPAFHVDGQLLHIRETFVITDSQGREVATIKQKLLALR